MSTSNNNSSTMSSNNSNNSTGDGDVQKYVYLSRRDLLVNMLKIEPKLCDELEAKDPDITHIFKQLFNDDLRNAYLSSGGNFKITGVRKKLLADFREIKLSGRLPTLQQRIAANKALVGQMQQELKQQQQQQEQQQQQQHDSNNSNAGNRNVTTTANNNKNDNIGSNSSNNVGLQQAQDLSQQQSHSQQRNPRPSSSGTALLGGNSAAVESNVDDDREVTGGCDELALGKKDNGEDIEHYEEDDDFGVFHEVDIDNDQVHSAGNVSEVEEGGDGDGSKRSIGVVVDGGGLANGAREDGHVSKTTKTATVGGAHEADGDRIVHVAEGEGTDTHQPVDHSGQSTEHQLPKNVQQAIAAIESNGSESTTSFFGDPYILSDEDYRNELRSALPVGHELRIGWRYRNEHGELLIGRPQYGGEIVTRKAMSSHNKMYFIHQAMEYTRNKDRHKKLHRKALLHTLKLLYDLKDPIKFIDDLQLFKQYITLGDVTRYEINKPILEAISRKATSEAVGVISSLGGNNGSSSAGSAPPSVSASLASPPIIANDGGIMHNININVGCGVAFNADVLARIAETVSASNNNPTITTTTTTTSSSVNNSPPNNQENMTLDQEIAAAEARLAQLQQQRQQQDQHQQETTDSVDSTLRLTLSPSGSITENSASIEKSNGMSNGSSSSSSPVVQDKATTTQQQLDVEADGSINATVATTSNAGDGEVDLTRGQVDSEEGIDREEEDGGGIVHDIDNDDGRGAIDVAEDEETDAHQPVEHNGDTDYNIRIREDGIVSQHGPSRSRSSSASDGLSSLTFQGNSNDSIRQSSSARCEGSHRLEHVDVEDSNDCNDGVDGDLHQGDGDHRQEGEGELENHQATHDNGAECDGGNVAGSTLLVEEVIEQEKVNNDHDEEEDDFAVVHDIDIDSIGQDLAARKRSIDADQDDGSAKGAHGGQEPEDEHRRKKRKAGTVGGADVDTPPAPDPTTSTPVIWTQRSQSENFIREVQRPLREEREKKKQEQFNELLKDGNIGVKLEYEGH